MTVTMLGSERPRIWTRPQRRLTKKTTRGYEAIEFAEQVLGIELYPWQRWFLLHALELSPDGTFRFRTLVLLVARQNGKTTLLLVLFLWRLYVDGARLVIGTAQNLDIAEETWAAAVELAQDVPELASEIDHVDKTNGKKTLRLQRGERYKVAAASRRGGRSLSGDFVGLDELREHQTWDAWAAVTKTTMARPRAQVLGASNAGDAKSVVLAYLRAKANTGSESSLGIFEWSAPDGCDLDDRGGWAQANPSLGYGITAEAIASARGTDPEDVFRTEVLCQWVDDLVPAVITAAEWAAHADPDSQISSTPMFAVDVAPLRDWACIAAAGATADGREQVEITGAGEADDLELDYRRGTSWVVPRLVELTGRWSVPKVALHGKAAEALTPDLEAAGLEVLALSGPQFAQACGAFYDAATWGPLVHLGQPELDAALASARKRDMGDDTWAWGRRKSPNDISPLVAATVARWGHVAGLAAGEVSVWSLSDVDDDEPEDDD